MAATNIADAFVQISANADAVDKELDAIERQFKATSGKAENALNEVGGKSMPHVHAQAADAANKTEAEFKRAADHSDGFLSGIGAKLGGILAGVGVGFFLKDATAQAEDANKTLATTQQIITSTGGAAGLTSKQLADMATNMEFKIGIDDEDITKASDVMLTFRNVTGDTFKQAMGAAADMSAVFGGDLTSSATQLGKALNDPIQGVTALRRVGVSFTDEQLAQIKAMQGAGDMAGAQAIVLKELQSEVGGAAEAAATGSEKMKVAFGEMKESIGGGIAAALQGVAPAVVGLLGSLGPALGTLSTSLGSALGPIVAAIGPTLTVIANIGSKIVTNLIPVFTALGPAISPIVQVVGVLANALSAGLGAAFTALTPSITLIAHFLDVFAEHLGNLLFDALDAVTPLLTTMGNILANGLARILPELLSMFDQLTPSLIQIATILGGALAAALPQLVTAFVGIFEAVRPLVPILVGGFLVVLQDLQPILPFLIDAFVAWKVATAGLSLVTGAYEAVLGIFTTTAEGATVATGEATVATEGLDAAMVANPVTIVVAAIAALALGLYEAYQHITVFHDAVDSAWQIMQSVWDFITNAFVVAWQALDGAVHTVIDTFTNLPGQIGAILTAVGNFVTGLPGMVATMVANVVASFVDLGVRALAAVTGFVVSAVEWYYSLPIKAAVALAGLAGAVVGKIVEMAGAGVAAVGNFVGNALSGLGNLVTGVPGHLAGFAGAMLGVIHNAEFDVLHAVEHLVTGALESVGKFVTGIPGALLGAGSALVSGLTSALKGAWNMVVDHLPHFHADPLGSFGPSIDFGFDFLRLQHGGIIDAPTVALLGERNRREVAIPVTDPGRAMSLMQQSGLGAMWDQRSTAANGPVTMVSMPGAIIQDATDVDLVAQRVGVALMVRGMG